MTVAKFLVLAATSLVAAAPALAQAEAAGDERSPFEAALGLPDGVRISGSTRARYESVANAFAAGRTGGDELLSSRTLVMAEVDAGPLTFTGEMLDARWLGGDEGNGAASQTDALEMIQLFASWTWKGAFGAGGKLKVDAGRFAMDIGSRRLVARPNFSNPIQAYDGVHVTWAGAGGLRVTALAVSPTRRLPSDIPSLIDNDVVLNPTSDGVRLVGAHVEMPLPMDIEGEAYVFELDERDTADAPSRNRDLTTVGGRLHRARTDGAWDFDIELAHQSGTARRSTGSLDVTDLDHEAMMLHLEGGLSFAAPMSPRVSVVYDFASGDESPVDGKSGRFDPLFGDRSFELGPTSIWGALARGNLSSPGIRLEFEPDDASDVLVMARHVELAEARDTFGNSGVADVTGASGRDVGQQVEVRYRRWLAPESVRLSVGGAVLFDGAFLRDAPNATRQGDALFGYSEISWVF